MIGTQFAAFLWLRWRLRVNQLKRGGAVNAVLLALLAGVALLGAGVLFVALFLVGLLALAEASPTVVLYVWDGLVAAFLFSWCLGLLVDLQRSESLPLQKFLHLPVSPTGAFVVNYLSSLVCLNLIVFVPALLGLSLGLVFSRGPLMLLLLPLVAACVLLVTALTHQFQSWLALLMSNPRRRRTVLVFVTMFFVLVVQLPNLLNLMQPGRRGQDELLAQRNRELEELGREQAAGRITANDFARRRAALERAYQERSRVRGEEGLHRLEQTVRTVNLCLPPGWLPLGACGLAEGEVVPALLGTLGLTLLGSASLWRSYRTTLRLYKGEMGGGHRRPAAVAAPAASVAGSRPRLIERALPGVPEHAAAIALAGFRSLLRAPEAKMILLTPIILVAVFGSLLLTRSVEPTEGVRPLMAFGGLTMVLLSLLQIVGKQFGFDRGGFRVFVLCPARRRDILLGKNLAVAPLALGLGTALVALVEGFYPMRPDHLLALVPTAVSMYLLFCLAANALSILVPMAVPAGSFKPNHPKGLAILLNLAFLFLLPLVLAPTLLPLGLEAVLQALDCDGGVPVDLLLSVAECAAVVLLYRLVLTWEGRWLAAREQHILQVVASRAE